MIPIDDRGLLLGDGLFETMLAVDGRLAAFEAHLARMTAGCAVLGLPPPDPIEAQRLCEAALKDRSLSAGRAAVRLTLTAGSGGRGLDRPTAPAPTMFASASSSQAPTSPAMLVTATTRRNEASPAARIKTLSYLDNVLARREATAKGADEALMLNSRGEVACAAAANLFWVRDGVLFTPALECGVLAGIERARVIATARARGVLVLEVRETLDALMVAEEAFLTNSLIGVRPVASIDGWTLGPGGLAAALASGD